MAPPVLRVLFLLLASLITACAADDAPLYQACSTTGNFTAKSTFSSNLYALLSNISTASINGYSNATVGAETNRVYGIANCRGDADEDTCSNCLSTAVTDVRQRCPFSRRATLRYQLCVLRYSNENFFGSVDTENPVLLGNGVNVTSSDAPRFQHRLDELMAAISRWAEFNSSGRLFAMGEVNFTAADPKIYGLVQCTRDLSPEGCGKCLQTIMGQIPKCCGRQRGGRIMVASCALQFELTQLYDGVPDVVVPDSLATAPSPPRLTPPEGSTTGTGGNSKSTGRILAIIIPVSLVVVLSLVVFICFSKRSKSKKPIKAHQKEISSIESLFFNLSTLRTATNNFAEANKLGEGGFGPVYKGLLADGREIAVKRLSANSVQGLGELKNEVALVAQLQHRNLVKLLGVCLEDQEKLLVYEYVPNRSLDTILFDDARRKELDWGQRFNIIHGVARGMQYLHEDSQLKIIHRDLKAGNVLLDAKMNPKISDFGMARLFGVDQTQARTRHVAGTLGYMAPEYVLHGQFSMKSDVFSFGILILEIITGRKYTSNADSGQNTYLLRWIWDHWLQGTIEDIVDTSLEGHFSMTEVQRCAHMALLCVQDDPAKRPSMSSIVVMLSSSSTELGNPIRPRFLSSGGDSSERSNSVNEVTITELEVR